MIVDARDLGSPLPSAFRALMPNYPKCAELSPELIEKHGANFGFDPVFLKDWVGDSRSGPRRSGRTFRGLITADLFYRSGLATHYVTSHLTHARQLLSKPFTLPSRFLFETSGRGLGRFRQPNTILVVDSDAMFTDPEWGDLAASTLSFRSYELQSRPGMCAQERARLQWDTLKGLACSADRDGTMLPLSVVLSQMARKWKTWLSS